LSQSGNKMLPVRTAIVMNGAVEHRWSRGGLNPMLISGTVTINVVPTRVLWRRFRVRGDGRPRFVATEIPEHGNTD
jgi:hypothetical protein